MVAVVVGECFVRSARPHFCQLEPWVTKPLKLNGKNAAYNTIGILRTLPAPKDGNHVDKILQACDRFTVPFRADMGSNNPPSIRHMCHVIEDGNPNGITVTFDNCDAHVAHRIKA